MCDAHLAIQAHRGAAAPASGSHIVTPVRGCYQRVACSLELLLNTLPAFHLADHFDALSVGPQGLPHVLDVLGRADEAGEDDVHALRHPEPQVSLVLLAHSLEPDEVAPGQVDAFAAAQNSAGFDGRVHPVGACGESGRTEEVPDP